MQHCSVLYTKLQSRWFGVKLIIWSLGWNGISSGSQSGNILSAWAGLCPSLQVVEGLELTYKSPLRKDSQLWMWQEALLSAAWLPPRKSNQIKGIENISDWLHPCRDTASSAYSVLAWLEIALDCFCTQYWKSGFNLMLNIVPKKNTFAATWYCWTHFYWSFIVRLSDETLIKRWKCGTYFKLTWVVINSRFGCLLEPQTSFS